MAAGERAAGVGGGGGGDRSSSSSSASVIGAATAAAAAALVTAAAAGALHLAATRRLTARLAEQKLAERRGRIRAEVKLRTLMKEHQQQRDSAAAAADSAKGGDAAGNGSNSSGDLAAETTSNHDMLLRCIGTVVSPFTKRMGTPRQGALAPHSRAYVQLTVPVQTVEGFELYSHAWILFSFHANTDTPDSRKTKIRPPRAPKGTKVGMLATRSPHRPNSIGLSLVKVAGVDAAKKRLHIAALDLVNGTPVYDIKPCVPWDVPGHHDSAPLSVPDWVSQEDALRSVEFTPAARASLERLVDRGKLAPLYTSENEGLDGAMKTIGEVLAQDPRAAKQRGSVGQTEPYRTVFAEVRVEFVVEWDGVKVLGAEPMDFDGAVFVDGVPLSKEGGIAEAELRTSEP